MRRPKTWLHVLLTLCLILNGVTAAHAATAMSIMHAASSAHPAAVEPTVEEQAPCHEMAGPDGKHDAGTEGLATQLSKHSTTAPAPDCCKSGGCNCDCVHQSQAAAASIVAGDTIVEHASCTRALKPAHPEALLLDLIRPPIA